jgi:hypothetical protein
MIKSMKSLNIDCYKIVLKKEFDKDEKMDLTQIELTPVDEKYIDAITKLLNYFSQKSELMGIEKIYRQGELLRPQFTGRRKKYEIPAIGLAVSVISYDRTRGVLRCRPLNLDELRKFYKYDDIIFETSHGEFLNNVSWFLELSQTYPFSIVRLFKVLYNSREEVLEAFLKNIYKNYVDALNETLKHLKVPTKPTLTKNALNRDMYIIVYRCQRSFVSAVLTPDIIRKIFDTGIDKLIFSNTVAYLLTPDESVAFYYSSILNYLVHEVKVFNGSFVINQYGRPVKAVKIANLEWAGEEWQFKVAELSRVIHKKARPVVLKSLELPENIELFEVVDRGEDIKIKEKLGERVENIIQRLITDIPEVKEVFREIDKNVDKKLIKEAIREVATVK